MLVVFNLFFVYLVAFHSVSAGVDREFNTSAIDVILSWGYPLEVHSVLTKDGYIIDMFRIPRGRFANATSSCHRPVVLMAPGVVGGAAQFFLNPPESSPAFILADAGIDVFMLNYRGTTYGKRHATLHPGDNKFWQFTLDELAKYDAPAAINKAIEVSGKSSLYWIGHSQGTAVGFMTLSEKPRYNSKVKALFQLGPAGTSGYAKGMMRFAFLAYRTIKPLVDLYRIALGSHEIIFGKDSVYISLCEFTPLNQSGVCERGIYSLFDSFTVSLNTTQESELLSHEHSGTSTWLLLHWAQMASRQTVEHMDHNPIINLVRYGQEIPPPYNYSNIDVPVYLFWSKDDWMTTAEEIEHVIMKMLRKEIVKGGREIPRYSHADFIEATDCAEKVFNPISDIVRRQEKGMDTAVDINVTESNVFECERHDEERNNMS